MWRAVNLILVFALIATAAIAYQINYGTDRASREARRLEAQIATERDRAQALVGEWTKLDQPARIQDLVGQYGAYLELNPMDPAQFATLDDIPFRQAAPIGETETPATTGSVKDAKVKSEKSDPRKDIRILEPRADDPLSLAASLTMVVRDGR
jgi:hypothetical protein